MITLAATALIVSLSGAQDASQDTICIVGNPEIVEKMERLREEIAEIGIELDRLDHVREQAKRAGDRSRRAMGRFSQDQQHSRGKLNSQEETFLGTYRGSEEANAVQPSVEHERTIVNRMNAIIELRKTKVLEFRALEREPKTHTECKG